MNGRYNVECFIIGLGLGVLGSFKYFEAKFKMKSDREIESTKQYFREMYQKGKKTEPNNEASNNTDTEKKNITKSSLEKEKVETYSVERQRTGGKYNTYVPKEDDGFLTDHPREEEGPEEAEDAIYEIDFDGFMQSNGYSKLQLNYYTDNHVVTSEEDNPEDEPEVVMSYQTLLGDVLETSGFITNDAPTIYVRNEGLSSDYEVTKLYAEYK